MIVSDAGGTRAPKGLSRARFSSQVDDYFLCKVCAEVAVAPVECRSCESVVCSACIEGVSACTVCSRDMASRDIARFAKKVYEGFVLTCKNHPNCQFAGSISKILAHETDCEYTLGTCENVLCGRSFFVKDAYKSEGCLCSVGCFEVKQLESSIGSLSKEELLVKFHDILASMRAEVYRQREAELRPAREEACEKLDMEVKFWNNDRIEVEKEIAERRQRWHSGKWSISAKWWTCCQSEEVLSIGCKSLL